MLDFLIYDAKVAVLIAVFYLFYRLLLAKETFHRVNRVVLLLTAVMSFVLPLCVITMHETVVVAAMPAVEVGEVRAVVADEPTAPLWQMALPVLFIIGIVATLGYTVTSLAKLMLLIRHSEKHQQEDGVVICVTDHQVSPFSWMHYIVLSRQDYAEHNEAVLAHERGHIRLRHSWDVLLVDTLTALQWFNPAMWMLRQDLRAIHEYEADGAVLSQGFNARQYQYLLITKAASIGGYSIANGISHSTLKNRIHMMLHKETRRSHLLKLLALVPIVGTAMALNARTVTDVVYDEPQKKQIIKKGKQNARISANGANEVVVIAQEVPAAQKEAETFKMRGVVRDQDGEPIVGAVITLPSSAKGTVTDMNGEFSMDVRQGSTVVAAYVGYASESIVANNPQRKYVFTLQKDGSGDSGKPFDVVEQMPQFPGGPAALMQFLAQNIRYPEAAHKAGIQGRVIANFVVEKDGSITEGRIVKSVSPELDAEALRVINSMPNWIPGMQNGEAVRVKYTIPVTFQLQGSEKPAVSHVMIGPEHKGKSKPVEVVIDGKVVDAIVMNSLNPSDIESIDVEKAKDGQPKDRIIIKMKQKKE